MSQTVSNRNLAIQRLSRLLRSFIPIQFFSNLYLDIIYAIYGIEGINRVMLHTHRPRQTLERFGAQIDEGTIIYPHVFIHAAAGDYSHLNVGKNCRILRDTFFDLTARIEIHDTVGIGARVSLVTHVNLAHSPLAQGNYPAQSGGIVVKPGAAIFTGAIILPGITVGECAVVAAGSVVSTDVPDYTVVVGNPARVVKKIVAS